MKRHLECTKSIPRCSSNYKAVHLINQQDANYRHYFESVPIICVILVLSKILINGTILILCMRSQILLPPFF